ncbi:MAG: TlpA family protein disulfide reductase [Actinobacteria bacterium]|nr:TlpA family protein disulfide reductase [Actinomycetota bacterium]
MTATESTLASVSPTSGLMDCESFADDDGTRDGWRGITFQCLADGSIVRGNQLRGAPTVAVVWASWCGPCREELPIFATFAREQSRVRVVGIGWRDNPQNLQKYAKQTAFPFASLVDRTAAISAAWNINAQPVAVFVTGDGTVSHVERGRVTSLKQLQSLAAKYAP